jgi:hypothetical protein
MVSGTGCKDVLLSDEKWRILTGHHPCRQGYATTEGCVKHPRMAQTYIAQRRKLPQRLRG